MRLKFTKMQGAGNDFVVIDGISQDFDPNPETIRRLSDRHFGIGADQVLLVEKTHLADVDFRYRIFNADGGEVEQCGNGARCFARFVVDKGLTNKTRIRVETKKRVIEPEILEDGRVRVMMGAPSLKPEDLPFNPAQLLSTKMADLLVWQYEDIAFGALSMGNPSAVIFVDNVDETDVEGIGKKICFAPCFPQQTNVVFLEVNDAHRAKVRVFERGAGETLACGSGTCSGVVASMLAGQTNTFVDVQARGGTLQIQWSGDLAAPVYLVGDAVSVFDGEILL